VAAAVVLVAGAVVVPLALLSRVGRGAGATPAAAATAPSSALDALPDVADVVCDGDGTHVLTPQIRPQPDGVHFRIDNRTGVHLGFEFRFGESGAGGDNAPVGTSEITRSDVPPGDVLVTCWDFRGQPALPKDPDEFVTLAVVDEDGIWTSPNLDCGDAGWVTGTGDYGEGAKGVVGDPVDLAKDHFQGLRATDLVRSVGYPQEEQPVVGVVRDGTTIATAEYLSDGEGGWLLSTVSRCQDSGLIG
jgi:hypothetical protein